VLIVETCGVALVEREGLRLSTGLPVPLGEGVLLLCSQRLQQLQLLQMEWS
jgi:hypothetical protein